MGISEFFLYVYSDWGRMLLSIIISLIIYILLYRKYFRSLLDPLTLMLLGSCMGCSVVIFLYIKSLILSVYFYSYISTQLFFYLGFRKGHNSKRYPVIKKIRLIDLDEFTKCFFVSAALIDISSQLLQYKYLGIPLFMSSRLNIMADAGGVGILTRFISVCRAFTILLSFYYINYKKSNILSSFSKVYIVYVILACFLSGSRGSILIFATGFFFYATIFEELHPKLKQQLSKYEFRILCVLSLFAIGINTVKYGSLINGVSEFGVRLPCYGDTYFYAYPNQLIEYIDDSQPFKSIFSSFLGFFRIYPYDELPNPIGQDLFHFFSNNGDIGGPNARHNIVSYLYFGMLGGLFFSSILGFIAGFFRKLFFSRHYKSILGATVYVWLYSSSCSIETDVNLYLFNVNSFIIVVPFIFFLGMLIYLLKISYDKTKIKVRLDT